MFFLILFTTIFNYSFKNQKKFETEQKEASGLDLSSFLILPVQRLPRYVLLLKELQRYTPENHPEYRGLVNATNHIANSLEIINESKREHEQSSHKMLNIDKSMVYEMDDFEVYFLFLSNKFADFNFFDIKGNCSPKEKIFI